MGGKKGFRELVQYSEKVKASGGNLGIYPDFDFAYINKNTATDSTSMKKHAVRTIDNRYSSKRYYSATKQKYISYFQYALSPAYFSFFYEKLVGNYDDYGVKNISDRVARFVAQLGFRQRRAVQPRGQQVLHDRGVPLPFHRQGVTP